VSAARGRSGNVPGAEYLVDSDGREVACAIDGAIAFVRGDIPIATLAQMLPYLVRLCAFGHMREPAERHARPYVVTVQGGGEYLCDAAGHVIASVVSKGRLDFTALPCDPEDTAELLPFLRRYAETGSMVEQVDSTTTTDTTEEA